MWISISHKKKLKCQKINEHKKTSTYNKFTYNMILLELQTGWKLDKKSFPNQLPFLHINILAESHVSQLSKSFKWIPPKNFYKETSSSWKAQFTSKKFSYLSLHIRLKSRKYNHYEKKKKMIPICYIELSFHNFRNKCFQTIFKCIIKVFLLVYIL